MDDPAAAVEAALRHLGIPFSRHDHPPVFTVDEAVAHWADIDAVHCKNLFLRNKKGHRHYLVVIEHRKSADLQRLAVDLGDDRLSFGSPDRLQRLLGLTAGAVSPFGLINDPSGAVQLVLDADLRDAARVAFHPNVNTATLVLSFADFERFVVATGHQARFVRV